MIDETKFYDLLTQTFSILLTLIGVVIVYRMQEQRERLKDSYKVARQALIRNAGPNGTGRSAEIIDHLPNSSLVGALNDSIQRVNEVQPIAWQILATEFGSARDLILRDEGRFADIRRRPVVPITLIAVSLINSIVAELIFTQSIHFEVITAALKDFFGNTKVPTIFHELTFWGIQILPFETGILALISICVAASLIINLISD